MSINFSGSLGVPVFGHELAQKSGRTRRLAVVSATLLLLISVVAIGFAGPRLAHAINLNGRPQCASDVTDADQNGLKDGWGFEGEPCWVGPETDITSDSPVFAVSPDQLPSTQAGDTEIAEDIEIAAESPGVVMPDGSMMMPGDGPVVMPQAGNNSAQMVRITESMGSGSQGFAKQQKGSQVEGGFRSHCSVSHFSYDDPIVKPGQPGAAHLHMFWGNTSTNANTTNASLTGGQSTCSDLGAYNNSAYWMPALIAANGQVVIPDDISVYYKTHEGGGNPNPAVFDNIMPIPNDFSMVSEKGSPRVYLGVGGNQINSEIDFHDCIQPKTPNGQVRYNSTFVNEGSDSCPAGYTRITRVIVNVKWNRTAENGLLANGWKFSDGTTAGNTGNFHADYMASWSSDAMRQEIITCNRDRLACIPQNEEANLNSIRGLGGQQLIRANKYIADPAPEALNGLPMMRNGMMMN